MCMPYKATAQKTGFNKVILTKLLSSIDIPLTMFLYVSRYDEISSMWCTKTMQHLNNRLKRWSLYGSDSFFWGAIKLSQCFCLFHGFAELSLLMKDVKHLMAMVMKSSPAKSTSTRKQSTIRSLPRVSWRSWKTPFTLLWNIINGCTLHSNAFGVSASNRSQTLSTTVRLWLVLSVIKKVYAFQQLFFSVSVAGSSS